jgi:predicted transcriptional regulator
MTAITLPADLEAWARAEVAAGRAESVEALVAEALNEHRADVEFVRAKLDEARASLARGEGVPLEEAFRQIDAWIVEDEAAAKALTKAAE